MSDKQREQPLHGSGQKIVALNEGVIFYPTMTLRDYFAAMAMRSMCASPQNVRLASSGDGHPLEHGFGLGLSMRARNALQRGNYTTLEQVAAATDNDLLKLRTMGKRSLREVRRVCDEMGLSRSETPDTNHELAKASYAISDSMLAERNKQDGEGDE